MSDAPITYVPGFIEYPDEVFTALERDISWERRPDAPRRECWMSRLGEPYTYGRGAGQRTYYPRAVPALLADITARLEEKTGTPFEGCFVNCYDGPRDHLGWHADDSPEIDSARPIAVISLGSMRRIEFRENGTPDKHAVLLEPGSLLLMHAGMQSTHQHRIPKHGASCGPRISLTFRGLVRASQFNRE